MHVTQSETYAEVRKLGVKAQGGVEWYVTEYYYILVYSLIYNTPDAWPAHWFCFL
jgi:hypothetical protein